MELQEIIGVSSRGVLVFQSQYTFVGFRRWSALCRVGVMSDTIVINESIYLCGVRPCHIGNEVTLGFEGICSSKEIYSDIQQAKYGRRQPPLVHKHSEPSCSRLLCRVQSREIRFVRGCEKFLPGPAWLLLSKTYKPPFLYPL